MALPGNLTTFTLTFGAYTDAKGVVTLVGATAKLFPADPATGRRLNLVHVETGQKIIPADIEVTIGADGTATVGPLPHTDNAGLSTVGFAYCIEWNLASSRPSPGNKMFAVPTAAGATVDFDLLAAAAAVPGVLVPIGTGPQGPAGPEGPAGPAGPAGSNVDATSTIKGVVQLAGDLAGTAAAPTVPGLAGKASATDPRLTDSRTPTDGSVTDAKVASGAAISADKLTDGTTNKLLTAAERTKLTGVATGATANSADATLLARANHTGTQSADTLTDGTTNKAFLATERTKLTGIAVGATANDTDANLKARANHTGTQAASTITGLAAVATSGAYADLTGAPSGGSSTIRSARRVYLGTLALAGFTPTVIPMTGGGSLEINDGAIAATTLPDGTTESNGLRVLAAGYYAVSYGARFRNGASGEHSVALLKNGTALRESGITVTGAIRWGPFSDVVKLAVNDVLKLQAYAGVSSVEVFGDGFQDNFITVTYLGAAAT